MTENDAGVVAASSCPFGGISGSLSASACASWFWTAPSLALSALAPSRDTEATTSAKSSASKTGGSEL
ncbi:hypothetical protein [Ruegeria hyattellae]|uniref:hypothetical protein n=1 Tax=Ruegeria hyattellae TaxID=3233337 RepID=UPI00355C0DB0